WWTSPTEAENGSLIMVTGRRDVDKFRNNPKFSIRVEVSWKYAGEANGMPDVATSELMSEVQDSLLATFQKDPVAVLTGIYTGDNRRDWVFYTLSTHIFQKKINESLEQFPVLTLEIYAENDPDWAEYSEMRELSEVTVSDD
ncbi:MAG: DUF695 domain-containing protein, partial [Muribaculaceae bacterium]|nr:DUF695 domain-containing protein [Muribaculaceae bacterium]